MRLDEAIDAAVADGMPALALTDLANVFGLVKFYKAARAAGVKAIAGCDVWIANETDRDKPFRLLLLCQSQAGYLRLCELLTRAYRTNRYRGRAELSKSWFSEAGTEGLIALSGAHQGDVGQALVVGNAALARDLARAWAALFPQPLLHRAAAAGRRPHDERRGCGAGGNVRAARARAGVAVEVPAGGHAPGAVS